MRYFFLVYALIALLVVGIFGVRGQKFSKPPIRIFPDMDEQDKLKAQKPDRVFCRRSWRAVAGWPDPAARFQSGWRAGHRRHPRSTSSAARPGYYGTGQIGDYYGSGMPEELQLTADNAQELIRRGQERFDIYCALCHGLSGDGQGITSAYGVPVNTNANAKLNSNTPQSYPDGRLFNTITNGMGRMSGYGYNIPVRDRWAIIAYIRTLQAAKQTADQAR